MGLWTDAVDELHLGGGARELARIATDTEALRVLVAAPGRDVACALVFGQNEAYALFRPGQLHALEAGLGEAFALLEGEPEPSDAGRAILDLPFRLFYGRKLKRLGDAPTAGPWALRIDLVERRDERRLALTFRRGVMNRLTAVLDRPTVQRLTMALGEARKTVAGGAARRVI